MLYIKDKEDRISKNFTLFEMSNQKDGGRLILSPQVIDFAKLGIQTFREWIGEAMTITSWYRTTAFNKSIGGADNSMHLQALAVDFQTPRHNATKHFTPAQWQNIIRRWRQICLDDLGIVGGSVEIAPTWVHLDVREWADKRFRVMNHVDMKPESVYVPADLIGKVTYKYLK
jgi:hypothetical protein